jgi:MYXO-CTERM domain-containing protein
MRNLVLKGLVGSLGLFALAAVPASAAEVFSDNFDGYADDTALNAVWPLAGGTSADSFLATDPNDATNKFVQETAATANNLGRRDRSFTPFVPTSTTPLTFNFTYIDQTGTASGIRQYNQVLANNASAGLSQLIAMGEYNNATSQDNGKYQARVAFGSDNWFNLNADRSAGPHDFTEEIFSDHVNFYVDGVLDTTKAYNADVSGGFYQVRIGSGLSSLNGGAGFDNYSVSTDAVPEPAALGLLGLGSLALLRRRRA